MGGDYMNMLLAAASDNMFSGVTSASFNGVLDQVVSLVPIVLPAVIGFLAFRKGWAFIKSAVKGA